MATSFSGDCYPCRRQDDITSRLVLAEALASVHPCLRSQSCSTRQALVSECVEAPDSGLPRSVHRSDFRVWECTLTASLSKSRQDASPWMMNHQGRPVLHMHVGKTEYPHADRRTKHVANIVIHGLCFVAVSCRRCHAPAVCNMIARSTQTGFCPFVHRLQVTGTHLLHYPATLE